MTAPNLQAARDLIQRIIPDHAQQIHVEPLPPSPHDTFEIDPTAHGITLRGNTAGSIASALYHYLTQYCNAQVTWNGTNLNLPAKLPLPPHTIRQTSPHKFRYYLNYCTFSYTTPWWDWPRWEKEIDWMALHGINMPLAVLGQNSVWLRTYRQLGFTDDEITPMFSGPAYVGFNWMGVLDAWDGPFPKSLLQSQETLQHKILQRQRELGMTPILPAFTGHVPAAFARKFPDSQLQHISWEGFPPTHLLDPHDPMFTRIGETFIRELTATYGTDHYYSADTFIEMIPPSSDPAYLTSIGEATYRSMAAADPDATWVMQGWMFQYLSDFWHTPQIEALLRGVPDDKMLILDLYSECRPVWNRTHGYFGKPWLWCMLHNFGGNSPLHGHMPEVALGPHITASTPAAESLSGIGLTMEGLEQNPVMYELMAEHTWTHHPIDLDQWLPTYIQRRYGQPDPDATAAWQLLRATVYNAPPIPGTPDSIINRRPIPDDPAIPDRKLPRYNPVLLARAWTHMLNASPRLTASDGFHYDLVDITRQVLKNHAEHLHKAYITAHTARNPQFRDISQQFLQLLHDLDTLLATRKDFLLGPWLESAKRLATTPEERLQFEHNARNIITTWGDKDSRLHDYVKRQWSGLISDFYIPRWQHYFNYMESLHTNIPACSPEEYHDALKKQEWRWVTSNETYPENPTGDPIQTAARLHVQYYPRIIATSP